MSNSEQDTIYREITAENEIDKIKIWGLRTGKLAIKKSAMHSIKPGLISTLFSFIDKEFGDWLPVWVWVIVHPEGTFLIDTGISSEVHQEGYFKGLDFLSRYYFETQIKFKIKNEEELDAMLKKVDIEMNSISKVILTHLHIDHTGGLKHLSKIPVLVNEKEWKTKDGSFPKLFPANTNIQTLKLERKYEMFEKCHFLTERKDLILIHTPGHTRGHSSIALLGNNNQVYLFGGDVAYTEEKLNKKAFSATIKNQRENQKSCDKILELAKTKRIVFLPTHDIDNVQRLQNV